MFVYAGALSRLEIGVVRYLRAESCPHEGRGRTLRGNDEPEIQELTRHQPLRWVTMIEMPRDVVLSLVNPGQLLFPGRSIQDRFA